MSKIIVFLFMIVGISGCNVPNREKSIEYVRNIAEGNYEKVLEETDKFLFEITPRDSFLLFSKKLNKSISDCFDNKLKIYFLSSEIIKKKNEKPATQISIVEICNDRNFVDIQLHFNLDTGKVTGVNVSEMYKVPSKTKYWVSVAIGLMVCTFVIYTIIRIKRSNMRKKWLIYFFVIFFNFPTLIVSPISTNLQVLKFQLMSLGFTAPNIHYKVEIALPIASIIMLIIISCKKKKKESLDNLK